MMFKFIRLSSLATFLGGISAFVYLASLPGDAQNGIWGFSPFRLVSLAGVLSVVALSVFLFHRMNSAENAAGLIMRLRQWSKNKWIVFVCFTLSLTLWNAFLLKSELVSLTSEAFYLRLVPLLLLGSWAAAQAGFVLAMPFIIDNHPYPLKNIWAPVWSSAAVIGFAVIFISLTGIGFTVDPVGLNWGPAGAPVTFVQANQVLSIGFLLFFLLRFFAQKLNGNGNRYRWLFLLDAGMVMVLWGAAVYFWSDQKISPTHFTPALSAPNYEFYPYSDAAIFDRASYHLLAGSGFSENLIRRPLYVGLLALFHWIGGTGYEDTVFIQILLLAFIPSLVYLTTSKLSNRLAGFLAGGLIVLREMNAIALSGEILSSHAKLIMSDLPATLGIIGLVYASLSFLETKQGDHWLLLILGAILGLLGLVRAQALILAPLILALVFFSKGIKKLPWASVGFIVLGLVLTLAPWVWRNWSQTGVLALGDTGENMLMARNYSLDPVAYPQPYAGETAKEFSNRLTKDILAFIWDHPDQVAFFASNHFMHSMALNTVFIAPVYSTDTPIELVHKNPFWADWTGALPSASWLPWLANLGMIVLGIGLAHKRHGMAGWIPLLVFMIYQAGNALARTSGWRFSLPVDWITLMYFSIGVSVLPCQISRAVGPSTAAPHRLEQGNRLTPVAFLIFFLMGASLPLAERFIPARDFDAETDRAQEALIEQNILSSQQLNEFLKQENSFFMSGTALYPRYYKPEGDIYLADMPKDFRYLHFWLMNDSDSQVAIAKDKPPLFFPHASEVSVLGCMEGNYIAARVVVLSSNGKQQTVFSDSSGELVCP